MGEFVRVEIEAGIATIRLDRPKMNALNGQVQREIGAAAEQVSADPEVHAVILYGGERIFAAGADVKEMSEASPDRIMELAAGIQAAFKAVARIPKPVVAAITGYALGGGLELALSCDLRVASTSVKITTAFAKVGLSGDYGGTYFLTHLLGSAKARELYLLSPLLTAKEALGLGMVTKVVPDAEVEAVQRREVGQEDAEQHPPDEAKGLVIHHAASSCA